MKALTLLFVIALGSIAGLGACNAETPKGGSQMTHEQGEAILAELKDIKKQLAEQKVLLEKGAKAAEAGAPSGPAKVAIDDKASGTLGAADAPVVVVEFTDYQCPFCRRFHDATWPELKKKYVDTGKVRFLVRDLPLNFHEHALPAAIAARCAGRQGKFWPVYEALSAKQDSLSEAVIIKTVTDAGVDMATLTTCRKDATIKESIDLYTADAERIGVTGTPGFLVAQKKGGKLEGTLLLGAQPIAVFSSRIDALLNPPSTP